MPAPIALAPIAWKVAQMGAVAALTWYVSRDKRPNSEIAGPRDIWREKVLNDVAEGVGGSASRSDDETRADGTVRFKRIVRAGADGAGVEIDATFLGRLRLRRV